VDADHPGSGQPSAWRLTFEYDGDEVRIVGRQRVAMVAPPDDSELLERGHAGYWIEVRTAKNRVLYRQVLHDPLQTDMEVFPADPSQPIERVPVQRPKGVFQVVVPDLPGGEQTVLHGRGSRQEIQERSTKQLVKSPLREKAPPDRGIG
jgi:hypothetical protein